MINPLQLSNVSVKGQADPENYRVREPLQEVVLALATKNPTWTFIGKSKYDGEVELFTVMCEDQEIGFLQREWSGRSGGYCVRVDSDNMASRIRTKDPKKAIREAQRNFVVKSEAKLVEESIRVIDDIIGTQRYRKNEKVRDRLMKLAQPMREYSLGLNKEAFIQFLATKDSTFVGLLNEYETTKAESDAIDAIVGYKDSNKVAYIKLYKGKYIVKTVDSVKTYDDNTLPEEYRGKLGMLKLVEDKQCISGVGCRAEADVFMITL